MNDLPSALAAFVELFNRGAFWESHEALETEWRRTRSPFYHGLILYASAWVHYQRGNRHGIIAQLDKADPLLRDHQPGYLGLDLGAIVADGARLRLAAEKESYTGLSPRILLSDDLRKGSEPELRPTD